MSQGSDWGDSVRKLTVGKIIDKRIIFLTTTGTMDQVSERVWEKGELTDGSKLKYNDDYDLYAYKPPSPVAHNHKGKTGKKIKGGYYSTYSAYKAQQGRPDLPFELTGDLRQSWLGGATPTPTEIDPLMCVIDLSKKEADKAEGLAKMKGPFLVLNEAEIAAHQERVRKLLAE